MFPLALLNAASPPSPPVDYNTVLWLKFEGADGSTIIDSTGRHTPSLSASGTRAILNNQLNLASNGYIRADAQSTASSDFDFSSSDFEIECKVTYTSGSYAWVHTADDNEFGLCLKFASANIIQVRASGNTFVMQYNAPTSFVGRQAKINVSRTGTRYSLKVDDVEVATSSNGHTFGSNGFIIGALPYVSSTMTGLIDDFIVKRKF
jgi:hypothetical protein